MADARTLECDLIMKGGVTSGIVYPAAVATIARQYRLRNIGGTSAGAIAAAAAAAMEYGLQTGGNINAGQEMSELPAALAERTEQGATRLDAMFSGDPGTAPLLGALKAVLNGTMSGLGQHIGPVWRAQPQRWRRAISAAGGATALQGLAGTALAGAVCHACGLGPALSAVTVVVAALASLVAAGIVNWPGLRLTLGLSLDDANRLLAPVIDNGLGLSTGMTDPPHTIGGRQVPPLTAWLHQTIQRLAGLDANTAPDILTFGKLWSLGTDPDHSALKQRAIDLVLVCSDLNRLQSVSFPFLPDNQRLFYDRREWERLFPRAVLAAMDLNAWQFAAGQETPPNVGYTAHNVAEALAGHGDLAQHLWLMPKGRDIPIVVAARASMAFPGLFTPLPLWMLRWVGKPEVPGHRRPVLSRVYLSDGGITSNFPIHLFDATIPSRPTFAINLLYPEDKLSIEEFGGDREGARTGKAEPGNVRTLGGTVGPAHEQTLNDLIMPCTNSDRVQFYKGPAAGSPISQISGLLGRIVETARTWGDVSLYNQPGVRDRVIHVSLTAAEGGFNLDMDKATIDSLDRKGFYAGGVLAQRFDPARPNDPLQGGNRPELDWQNHRRLRLNGFLAAQDLVAGRFITHWQPQAHGPQTTPPITTLVAGPHFGDIAGGIAGMGALAVPQPDPLGDVQQPLSLLRLRPPESDPRATRRPPPPPARDKP